MDLDNDFDSDSDDDYEVEEIVKDSVPPHSAMLCMTKMASHGMHYTSKHDCF